MASHIIVRNAITDAVATLDIKDGRTVHDLVTNSQFIAPGNPFSVRDKNGVVVDSDLALDHANSILTVGLPDDRRWGGGPELLLVLNGTLLPGVVAFFAQIGNKLGKKAADRITDIKLWKRDGGIRAEIVATKTTTIDIPDDLSDEARLALLELDINDPEVHGKRLYWDGQIWRPADRS
ncbi:MAG TPA: hypothetical protein VMC03_10870 [Streptosporangiaceae bacterium]|nr:hypothetical protein [Streptosporangiaceae bacterium]